MPLQTFYNLDNQRKEKILLAAYEEFALNNYKTASVSSIVKKLGIAKGSFYRYFKNKLDLYTHLVDNAFTMRMKQLDELVLDHSLSFFDILENNFRDKIQFDLDYPIASGFMYNVMLDGYNKEIEHIVSELKTKVIAITKKLIIQFQDTGQLNKSIDPQIGAFLIFQLQLGVYDYLSMFTGIDFIANIKSKKPVFSLESKHIMEIVKNMVEIIKNGFSKNESK